MYFAGMAFVCFNGKMADEKTALLPAASRALRYGDGLFETMRWHNNRILFADEHFARLWMGMKYLHFDIPVHFSPEMLTEQIEKLVTKNNLTEHARIRLTVFRGNGGLYDAESHLPNYIIESMPVAPFEWNSNGLVLGIYRDNVKPCTPLSNIKSNNSLLYVLGAAYAKQHKCNDAVILNQFGNVCETTIANVFIEKEGVIYTPPLSEGCVDGIMRRKLIEYFKMVKIPFEEKPLPVSDITSANEVFISNVIKGIKWVHYTEENKYTGNRATHRIYNEFAEQMTL